MGKGGGGGVSYQVPPPTPEEREMQRVVLDYVKALSPSQTALGVESTQQLLDWLKAGQPLPETLTPDMEKYISEAERAAQEGLIYDVSRTYEEGIKPELSGLAARNVLDSSVTADALSRMYQEMNKDITSASYNIRSSGLAQRMAALQNLRGETFTKYGFMTPSYQISQPTTAQSMWTDLSGQRYQEASGNLQAALANQQARSAATQAMWSGIGSLLGTGIGSYGAFLKNKNG